MNIEIEDEQIERLAQSAIQIKVNEWFKRLENKNIIKDCIQQCVQNHVQQELATYELDVQKMAKEVRADKFAEKLTTGIAEEIAREFRDRYDY